MKPGWKVVLGVLGLAALITGAALAPHALRRMETFRVRRVEVRGTRFLAPHEALKASGIAATSNVFDDFDTWQRALLQHSLVKEVTLSRKLPGTILISIVEAEPIALVAGRAGGLQPVNALGELLPIDPASVDLDLPIISGAGLDGRASIQVANADGLRLLRLLESVRNTEPALYGWISDAEPARGAVRVRLRSPAGAIALLPAEPNPMQLRELRTTLADLAARQDMPRLIRIDARYQDQIVAALSAAPGSTITKQAAAQ